VTTATRFTRTAALVRLLALLELTRRADPSLVPAETLVRRGLQRDPMTGGIVALGDLDYTGNGTAVPTMKRGRLAYNDQFSLEVLCIAWESGTADFTEVDALAERCAELVRVTLADHPQLDQDGDGLPGLTSATLTECDGPNPWYTPTGVGSGCRLLITFDTRIEGSA